jgi:tetratricopeptide (TPR) repeat protein
MAAIGEVFISHTHADQELAHALSDAIQEVFGDLLTTSYSTKKELDGGIKPGEDWFRWIVERVRESNVAVILLTPSSAHKPWVLWEAGAVYGAGIASAGENARKVRPLVFKLSGSQVPSPFAGIQGVNGDERSGIEKFLNDLIADFSQNMSSKQVLNAGKVLEKAIGIYLERVQKALRDAPLAVTEASVQEWCDRLDKLEREKRHSEVGHLHDWLNLTFGRDRAGRPLPLDLRLHRRLAGAYLAAKQPDRASREFELALEFAPRDIFLLRGLGTAYLDANRLDDAAKVVDRIAELDQDAFRKNVECAALKGRLHRERNDFEGAAKTYQAALEDNPDSYYLADICGQTFLRLGKIEEARSAYRRASETIERLAEQNVWTHATSATARLVMGEELRALPHLRQIAALKPDPGQLKTIEDGLERVQQWLGLDAAAFERWRSALRGQS